MPGSLPPCSNRQLVDSERVLTPTPAKPAAPAAPPAPASLFPTGADCFNGFGWAANNCSAETVRPGTACCAQVAALGAECLRAVITAASTSSDPAYQQYLPAM